ncbi:MAG: ribbon-helix-helix protein, CopG family [Clostridia bacterium]|nr:ribbon-helix-helix protein, CopG family [Clostridia bacterium]
MAKSIYSLVLDDDVIALVDRMAYAQGASRSALINRILAEHVGYSTHEMRTRDIFRQMEYMLADTLLPMLGESGDTTMRLRSALSYKYNPTVKYTVALGREGGSIGELRVQVRSRSDGFTLMMLQFFRLWAKLEEAYIGRTDISFEPGRLTRKLVPHSREDGRIVETVDGNSIAAYINALDGAMKAFFASVDDAKAAAAAAESYISDYVKNNEVIM